MFTSVLKIKHYLIKGLTIEKNAIFMLGAASAASAAILGYAQKAQGEAVA